MGRMGWGGVRWTNTTVPPALLGWHSALPRTHSTSWTFSEQGREICCLSDPKKRCPVVRVHLPSKLPTTPHLGTAWHKCVLDWDGSGRGRGAHLLVGSHQLVGVLAGGHNEGVAEHDPDGTRCVISKHHAFLSVLQRLQGFLQGGALIRFQSVVTAMLRKAMSLILTPHTAHPRRYPHKASALAHANTQQPQH